MATAAPPKTRSPSTKRAAAADAEPRADNNRPRAGAAKPSVKPAAPSEGASRTTLIAVGAAGLAVGLAANVARKLAVQAPTLVSGEWDEALTAEHKLTLKVFDAIEATTEANTTKRAALLMNLKHMLAKHAMEEENVIYPALREAGAAEEADSLNNDHGYVKQYLYELGEIPNASPRWIVTVRAFRTALEKHMREEETEVFPSLKAKLSPAKTKELTALMNKEGLKLA